MKRTPYGWKRTEEAGRSGKTSQTERSSGRHRKLHTCPSRCRRSNGYTLVPALVCLMVTAAVVAVVTARMDAWVWLQKAQQRSTWELSVIDQAKSYWHDTQMQIHCRNEEPEAFRDILVQEDEVHLERLDTAIRVTGRYGTLMLYIDSGGIAAMEWQ